MKKSLIALLLLVSFTTISFAQVTTSAISGVVYDDGQQALPSATVVAVHTPTGTKYGGTTNFDGVVNLRNMRVGGPYTITVSYVGFQTEELTDVFLTLGKSYDFTVTLKTDTEELQEVIVEVSQDNTFSKGRTGAETSVGRKELTALPTISRSAADFTRLEPSASSGSFGGRNDQFNNYSLDGSIFNNPFGLDAPTPGGQTGAQPISLDAIDQISVATAPYDVTQSGFTGASVNAVTKSGTNDFHGTVYGFFRNQDLTGGKVRGEKIFVPKLEQKQYGFSVGGPIVRNKLFFFVNFERDDRIDSGSDWVPNTGSGAVNESRVSLDDMVAVRDKLLGLGYDPGAISGYTHQTESKKGIVKLDWNINDNHRLAMIYNFLDASKEKPAHPTALGFRGPSANTIQFENAGYQINNELHSVMFELNSNFGSNTTNKLQVGYTDFNDFRNPFSSPAPSITIQENGSNYIIAGHEPFSINNKLEQKVFQFTDNLTHFVGSHAITIGISYERYNFGNSFNLGVYGGSGTFYPTALSVDDFLNDRIFVEPEGTTVESLLNTAISLDESLNENGQGNPGGFNWYKADFGQMAFYLQDEWNVTDNFRMTLGIRFDKPLYYNTSRYAQEFIDTQCCYIPEIEYFDPETGEEVFFDSTEMPTKDILFSPRFGFNWDVYGDSRFQVRGGSGIFTGRLPFVWLGNQVGSPNFFFYQVVDPDFKWPQVWRTNLGVDYRFKNDLVLSSDLSYTKDINGAHVQNWGLNVPTGSLNDGIDGRPTYTDADKNSFQNGAFVFTNSDKGRIWNWSVKVQKNFENDFFFSAAYNYMNSKDVNSIEAEITGDAFAGNPALNNVNDDVLSYSKYGDDHRFIGVISKKWTYGGTDQWSTLISGVLDFAQGGRFSYTYGGDINNDGSNLNDLIYVPTEAEVGQMNFSGPGQAEAFNDFIAQDDYLRGRRGQYAERYAAISPWRNRVDLRVLQDFHFNAGKERNTIQFSIDILNFGNMISSDWGVIQQPNSVQPIGVTVDPATNVPTYTFDGTLTKTFAYDSSIESRWQMQFGLRYIF